MPLGVDVRRQFCLMNDDESLAVNLDIQTRAGSDFGPGKGTYWARFYPGKLTQHEKLSLERLDAGLQLVTVEETVLAW